MLQLIDTPIATSAVCRLVRLRTDYRLVVTHSEACVPVE
jgi:hypothetical protein